MTARLVALATTAAAVLLFRPAEPGHVPEDLAEVLLRELLENRSANRIFYVEVDGRDASPRLLRRLADVGVRLKPRSIALVRSLDVIMELSDEEHDEAQRCNVKDRETGEEGTILRVGNLKREGWFLFSLAVDSGSYTGTLNAAGKRCTVLRLGKWRITGATLYWVS